jgi:hypothetical protein
MGLQCFDVVDQEPAGSLAYHSFLEAQHIFDLWCNFQIAEHFECRMLNRPICDALLACECGEVTEAEH